MEFTLNGQATKFDGDSAMVLLSYLRDVAGLKSPKDGCSGEGICGCCTILVDGKARLSCRMYMKDVADRTVTGFDAKAYEAALAPAGYPKTADKAAINRPVVVLLLVILMIYVAMVYGPIAAFLVELFPTNIRYTSMSLPYHIGNGWFGGFLPLIAASIVVFTGDIYAGLWYPIGVAFVGFLIGAVALPETKDNEL